MIIDIIDNAGALHVLEYEFEKKGIKVNTNEVVQKINSSLGKLLNRIYFLFEDVDNKSIKANLEQRSKTDNSIRLASIDIDLSTSEELIFYIYFDTLIEIANSIHFKEDSQTDFIKFENTLTHELVHAADLFTLKKINKLIDREIRLSKKSSFFNNSIKILDNEEDFNYDPLHWHFLRTINRFRNEGVAILGEKLFGTILERFYPDNQSELFHFFRRLMLKIQKITNENIFSIDSNSLIYDELTEFSLHAYNIGDFILLKLIGKIHPELFDLSEKAVNYILLGDKFKPTIEESKQLMEAAFQLDLSDYVSGLISCHFEEINQPFILKESLFEYCALVQDEINKEGLESFSKNIAIVGHNYSIETFIQLMKETVYTQMSNDEIISGYNQFIAKKFDENIFNSVKTQAELLFKKAIKENNEIAKWALTYLLDDEDLVFDRISILGWQDDWLVLDAALRIIYK